MMMTCPEEAVKSTNRQSNDRNSASDNITNSHLTNSSNAQSQSPLIIVDRAVTVLEDPSAFNIKHPLQYTWNLWLKDGSAPASSSAHRPGRSHPTPVVTSGNWKDQLQDIDAISTVEDFWGWFNSIPKASAIADASDYFLFKEGIAPEWEDKAHVEGGSLTFNLPRGSAPGAKWQYVDDCWLNAMMACVGCQFELHDQVTGVQFACRERGSRIILWMRTVQPALVDSIKADFGRALQEGLPEMSISLLFDNFAEKKARSSAPRRSRDSRDSHGHGGAGRGESHHRGAGPRYFL